MLNEEDLLIETHMDSENRFLVKVTHEPTGQVVVYGDNKSQEKNLEICKKQLELILMGIDKKVIHTSYLAKARHLPKNMKKILVTTSAPDYFYNSTHYEIIPDLGPSYTTLFEYKENGDWDKYVEDYKEKMQVKAVQDILNSILTRINDGEQICLLCYEKDYEHCHRSLLAQWFVEHGIEWNEVK